MACTGQGRAEKVLEPRAQASSVPQSLFSDDTRVQVLTDPTPGTTGSGLQRCIAGVCLSCGDSLHLLHTSGVSLPLLHEII